MKAGTSSSPKVRRLARRLGIERVHAIGILALLWEWTAGHAPAGDVGRWDDDDIADAVDWPEDRAEELVAALVACRWLDVSGAHRLVVHDWSDHCPEYVRKRLRREGRDVITSEGRAKSNGINGGAERQTMSAERQPLSAERTPTKARQGKARQGKGERARPCAEAPEPSPHPPAESPEVSEPRTVPDPTAETVAAVIVRLDRERGRPAARPPAPAELDRLAALVRQQEPVRVLAALDAYVGDDHPSTAALTVREFLGAYDRMAGIAARPRASPGSRELEDTLRLGARPEARPPPERPDPLRTCGACGHRRMQHSDRTGCLLDCPCEHYTEEHEESAAASR